MYCNSVGQSTVQYILYMDGLSGVLTSLTHLLAQLHMPHTLASAAGRGGADVQPRRGPSLVGKLRCADRTAPAPAALQRSEQWQCPVRRVYLAQAVS